ncbi:hypothetical protein ACWENQ_18830 [Nonomuraea sp. NPDC004354]
MGDFTGRARELGPLREPVGKAAPDRVRGVPKEFAVERSRSPQGSS